MMKYSILIVDDEATLAETFRDHFAGSGYDAACARSGEEALEMIRAWHFDVVVTDLKMPGMGGVDLLRATREMAAPPSIILMTAYGTMERAVEAFRLGLADLLQKPVSLDELSASVERALAARAARAGGHVPAIPLRVLGESSRRAGAVRAEVAGDVSAPGATAVWRLRALDDERTGFIWAHVVPHSPMAVAARLIIRTLADAVDPGEPAAALDAIVHGLAELDCGAALRAISVGVVQSKPVRRAFGAARGCAGVFGMKTGGSQVEPLAQDAGEAAYAWETSLAPEDMLLLADPRLVMGAGECWAQVLSATKRCMAQGKPDPVSVALATVPATSVEAPVMVALRLGEAIRSDGPTHVRVPATPASLDYVRDVAEQFALDCRLDERAAHELVTAVQEAVLNGIRWAYPERHGVLSLTLLREAGRVRASVCDEGVGFDARDAGDLVDDGLLDPLRRSGRGLALMQRLADGFKVTSHPGCGTSVVLEKKCAAVPAGGVLDEGMTTT